MIITGLLTLIYGLLSVLLVFRIPAMPESVMTVLGSIGGYLSTGVSMLTAFVGSTCVTILGLLLSLVLLMHTAYFLWSFVFWVIRKIPILGVKE